MPKSLFCLYPRLAVYSTPKPHVTAKIKLVTHPSGQVTLPFAIFWFSIIVRIKFKCLLCPHFIARKTRAPKRGDRAWRIDDNGLGTLTQPRARMLKCARSEERTEVYFTCPKLCRKAQFERDEGGACPSVFLKSCPCPNLRLLDLGILGISSDLEYSVIILAHGWLAVSLGIVLTPAELLSLHSLVAPDNCTGASWEL